MLNKLTSHLSNIGIDFTELIENKSRNRKIITMKRVCIYYLRKEYTVAQTARIMKMNHSTVIHHHTKAEDYIFTNDKETTNFIKLLSI